MNKTLWGTAGIALPVLVVFLALFRAPTPEPIREMDKIEPYLISASSTDGKVAEFFGNSRFQEGIAIGKDLAVEIYPEDRLQTFPPYSYGMGGVIKVTRAPQIIVNDWGKDQLYRSFASTVGDFLTEKQIYLGNDDKVALALDSKLTDGQRVKITRVAVTEVAETKPIDFKTITKDDPNLDEGKTRVERAGKKGTLKMTYRVTRENGVQKSKVLINTERTLEPVEQLSYRGTRPVITVACKYNGAVIAAATKYSYSANKICNLMIYESMGRANAVNPNGHYGLFQYDPGAFESDARSAGFGGASIYDPTAQIYAATWALTHGKGSRW